MLSWRTLQRAKEITEKVDPDDVTIRNEFRNRIRIGIGNQNQEFFQQILRRKWERRGDNTERVRIKIRRGGNNDGGFSLRKGEQGVHFSPNFYDQLFWTKDFLCAYKLGL